MSSRPLFGWSDPYLQPPRWLDPPEPDGPDWDEDVEEALRAVCVRPTHGGYGCRLCGPCREAWAREDALRDEARDALAWARDALAWVRGEAA